MGSDGRTPAFIIMDKKIDAAKIVAASIIGADYRLAIIADKTYLIKPPTIHQIAGATYWLSDLENGNTIKEILEKMPNAMNLAKALSWFIQGDDSIADELANGTIREVIEGIESAFSLIETENFLKLSVLLRSAKMLIAKQR